MPDLNALVLFAKVVEAGSFSEAARRLGAPVSTVSRRVAELEDQLGLRLLERSTRSLRLTDLGAEILLHAQRTSELDQAVESVVSNTRADVSGSLRLSSSPNISESLVAPLLAAFGASFPQVRVHVLVTQRYVDPIVDGVDLALRVGELPDSALIARRLLRYRHRLVASPTYLARAGRPEQPRDLLNHALTVFSPGEPTRLWRFAHTQTGETVSLSVTPRFSMNDYAGVAALLLSSGGIGDLSPIVRADLLRDGALEEVMPQWRFPAQDLSLVQLSTRHVPAPVRVFKEFAHRFVPKLVPDLPE